jgi:hypothetical protein
VWATVESARFRDDVLPAVGLFDVLEHVEDDTGFLQYVRSLMKPGGRLYLTVPAFHHLWSVDDEEAGHFRRYSSRSLRRCLEGAGFSIEYMTYFFWFLPLPVLVCRTLPSLIGIKRTISEERVRREHATSGTISALLGQFMAAELKRMQRGRTIPFGSSCLLVARRG